MYYQRFQVQQEVNSEFKLEDVNIDLNLPFLKLIHGTWLVEISKEIYRVLLKNAKLKWFKRQIFENRENQVSQNMRTSKSRNK